MKNHPPSVNIGQVHWSTWRQNDRDRKKASTAFYNVFSSPLPSTMSSPLPFIMFFHVHCLVSSKKFKFKFIQVYPEKDIPRRWTKKREMNAILVVREARDEGKKYLESE